MVAYIFASIASQIAETWDGQLEGTRNLLSIRHDRIDVIIVCHVGAGDATKTQRRFEREIRSVSLDSPPV